MSNIEPKTTRQLSEGIYGDEPAHAEDVPAYFLSLRDDTPCAGFWDYGLIEDLLAPLDKQEVRELPSADVAVVVIPARSHAKEVGKLNKEIAKIKRVVLMLMGDEESVFPVEKISHPNIFIWVQNPKPGRHDSYTKLGTGYPPQIHEYSKVLPNKTIDSFFAGQDTHSRRHDCIQALEKMPRTHFLASDGFTQGYKPQKYYELLQSAKTAPCPSGPVTVDTFRLFEALQLGVVPIADNETPTEDWTGFWDWLFGSPVPFPAINDWNDLPGYTEDMASNYPAKNNRIQAWFMRYKNDLRRELYAQVGIEQALTVIVPVSPIESHPSTDIVVETIESVKTATGWCSRVDFIITFDGVREEQRDWRPMYEEHIRRLLWHYKGDVSVRPYIFDDHLHQVGMMRTVIDDIKSDLLLYMEQDTPLVTDEPIDFSAVFEFIKSGRSNLVRFHHEGVIPAEHKHLMLGDVDGVFQKTIQWSQRPHIASVAFYRRLVSESFSAKARCFIEDVVHGKVLDDYNRHGMQGWNQWKLHIYIPGENIKRSYHTDGRNGEAKYDDTQIF